MLPRKHRLVTKKEFKDVLSSGRKIQGQYFRLAILKTEPTQVSTFGIIVSNKVSKKAAVRNAIRRFVRSFIHEKIDKAPKGHKIVIVANIQSVGIMTNPQSTDKNKEQLTLDLENVYNKAFDL